MLTNTLWLAQITNKATCLMASRKLEKVHSPSTMNFIFVYHKCFIFYNVDLYKLFDASGIEPPIYRLLKLIERHQIHISPRCYFFVLYFQFVFSSAMWKVALIADPWLFLLSKLSPFILDLMGIVDHLNPKTREQVIHHHPLILNRRNGVRRKYLLQTSMVLKMPILHDHHFWNFLIV